MATEQRGPEYTTRHAPLALRELAASIWTFCPAPGDDGSAAGNNDQALPDERAALIMRYYERGARAFVRGPLTRYDYVILPPCSCHVGVRRQPAALAEVLRVAPRNLSDTRVAVVELHPTRQYAELPTGDTLLVFTGEQLIDELDLIGAVAARPNRPALDPIAVEICFVTEQLDADLARVIAAGAIPVKPITAMPWGKPSPSCAI